MPPSRHHAHHTDHGDRAHHGDLVDRSLRHHTRQVLSDIADTVEVMKHTVTALDVAMVEATADHEADDLNVRVAAAQSALTQITATVMAVERALGKLGGLAQAVNILDAERPL